MSSRGRSSFHIACGWLVVFGLGAVLSLLIVARVLNPPPPDAPPEEVITPARAEQIRKWEESEKEEKKRHAERLQVAETFMTNIQAGRLDEAYDLVPSMSRTDFDRESRKCVGIKGRESVSYAGRADGGEWYVCLAQLADGTWIQFRMGIENGRIGHFTVN